MRRARWPTLRRCRASRRRTRAIRPIGICTSGSCAEAHKHVEETMARPVSMTKVPTYTSYEEWMRAEGIPIVEEECGIRDVTTLERQPWPRLEGKGAFIYLEGLKEAGFT